MALEGRIADIDAESLPHAPRMRAIVCDSSRHPGSTRNGVTGVRDWYRHGRNAICGNCSGIAIGWCSCAGCRVRAHAVQLTLAVKGVPTRRRPTVGEIAERPQDKHNTVVELLDRLESRHLIQRQRVRHNHRVVHVSLTPAGEALLRTVASLNVTGLRTAAPALVEAVSGALGRGVT
jgi:DNA-binding MarR family transcriptional regulator